MYFRKIYLKIRLYLYSVRHLINSIVIFAMALTLTYLFINTFVFNRVINGQASNDVLSEKYGNAIKLYNIEEVYYNVFHSSPENKEIYLEIPYRKAICYLKNNEKQKSIESMSDGLAMIQRQYGVLSRESSYFIRKYLIEYYLDNNRYQLAAKEFDNLLIIYKKIGYNAAEMADLVRLSGDLYYAQKKYDIAMDFYRKAYNTISQSKDIDYDTFVKIVSRIANYEIDNKKIDVAVNIYQSSIDTLKASGKNQGQLAAYLLIQLGDLYSQNDKTKEAIKSYEDAITLIETLPRINYLRQNKPVYLTTLKALYNKDGQFHQVDVIDVKLARERRFPFLN